MIEAKCFDQKRSCSSRRHDVIARLGLGPGAIALSRAPANVPMQLTQAQVNEVQARFTYLRTKAQIEAILGRRLP